MILSFWKGPISTKMSRCQSTMTYRCISYFKKKIGDFPTSHVCFQGDLNILSPMSLPDVPQNPISSTCTRDLQEPSPFARGKALEHRQAEPGDVTNRPDKSTIFFPLGKGSMFEKGTLQGINISHLGKRKIIFKMPFLGDMLVPSRERLHLPSIHFFLARFIIHIVLRGKSRVNILPH